MQQTEKIFLAKSEVKAQDLDHRRKINFSIKQYDNAFQKGRLQFADMDTARERAKNVKWRAIENLDKYLEQFERIFTSHGGHVIWAENTEDARLEILKICKAKNAGTVVKSKSMVTEEIQLNDFLKENNIESIETDLGEFIQQLDGEPPYHIVSPAMHKSKEDIAKLFHETLQVESGLTPEQMTLVARANLRQKFQEAEIGITGANFILADIGGIAITENEGNARLSTTFPKTHIVLTGIEKVLPSINDLGLFWPLLATYGAGQNLTVYNTVFTGPRKETEIDGPDEMYVILLDNGRANMLANEVIRESLYCIRCGACLNASPVYKIIGGHAYGTAYPGPIGAVITPHLKGMKEYKHLSYASPLSGAPTEACPVKINLLELLLENRHEAVESHLTDKSERLTWQLWKRINLSRKMMNLPNNRTKNKTIKKMFGKGWGERRDLPDFAPRSFNQLWKERRG